MSISADEVNYLIYRYLQENGFAHSAFTFAYESLVAKSSVAYTDVPPGALIAFLQKGLEYVGIEEHINEDGTIKEFDGSTHSLLSPFICDAVAIKEDRRSRATVGSSSSQAGTDANGNTNSNSGGETSGAENATGSTEESSDPPPSTVVVRSEGDDKKWLHLAGHQGEVFMCTWNPIEKQLASGSADGVCRLWGLNDITQESWNNATDSNIAIRSAILSHTAFVGEKFKDVTSVTWSPDGQSLSTGCYDGVARVWTAQGELKQTLAEHSGPVFSLKWNKSGTLLLSGSYDRRAIIWNPATGAIVKTLLLHDAPVFDVDWKDDDVFATCSSDKTILICSVNSKEPHALKTLTGHTDEVNALCWSPDGKLLASCSDDKTAKIWSMESGLVFDLVGHTKEIYTLRWVPATETNPQLVCTASFDGSVKVWDSVTGLERFTLRRQAQPVYSISPSPSAEFLAMGSLGGYVSLWNLKDGTLHKEFRGSGDTFDVSWSTDGSMLCSCFSSGTLCIVDTTR